MTLLIVVGMPLKVPGTAALFISIALVCTHTAISRSSALRVPSCASTQTDTNYYSKRDRATPRFAFTLRMDDFFSKVSKAASAATTAAKAAGAAAMQKASALAADASEAAKRGASDAKSFAARQLSGGSPALALVGTEITVKGRTLRIESLLAEGASSLFSVPR